MDQCIDKRLKNASFAVVGHLNTGIGGFLPARFHIPLDKADTLIEQNNQAAGEFCTVKCIHHAAAFIKAVPACAEQAGMPDGRIVCKQSACIGQLAVFVSHIKGIEQLDKVINIDQSPIGRTPRSNPATYTGLFDQIRDLFATTPDAKARGYKKGRFSFNVKGGRCEACSGDGIIKIEMHFLPDVYVPCEVCGGKRYNRETLDVKYKGKSIADVLDMTVEEALAFFENVPQIRRKVETLYNVGLSYIKLGQPSTTLSGGEAQRIKLATELSKRSTGRTIYILDEPTTGLHFADVHKLVEILQKLTDGGNTVLVIEHNLDVIKTADHIIDIGPEGGEKGGTVIAQGTPEEVAENPASYTGIYVKKMLERDK